jgi:uncharacterized protein (TIGR03437 family)
VRLAFRGSTSSTWLLLLLGFASAPSSPASEADALAISANIQANHLPYGTILDPVYAAPDSNQLIGYSRCGDSAIWTGHYLAAEAFRYKVTNSDDALANMKAAIAGIKSLADVTGNNLLARCLVPMDSPFAQYITQAESANGIHTNSSAGYYWIGNTSRDEYCGVIFGLAVAYDMTSDSAIRASISELVTRLVDFVKGHDWSVVMPDGSISTTFLIRPEEQLTFLQVGRHVNSGHYSTDYDIQKILLSATTLAPIGVDVESNSSYFKFNLDEINLYNLIRLEGSSVKTIYEQAYSILYNHVKDQQNAFFNMIDRALNSADATRDAATVSMLDQWLARPKRDPYVDLRGQLPSCNSADEACSPIPVPQRPTTDFLWQRDPFLLDGGGYGTIEGAGIDYILPYWMARYYNIVSADSVVSAASQRAPVAGASIASYYGSKLAIADTTANSTPLPTALGGITVQVQDSAGATRPAPLFFVSQKQVNFEIPDGTATGPATFVVVDSGGAKLGSSSAIVQNVAPSLFTADASGKGVAAALSVQVGVNAQQSVKPIFQCANGACSSVPINLGVDTPTYLSLYGTGIRNRSSLANVSVTIAGASVPVGYAGAQGGFVGLDQVNVLLPLSLRGTGETDLILTVDGQTANTVRVNVQ